MNPVNATALYISASRLVLNYDPGDPKAFTEINRLLPYFRQSLSCCVCGETPFIVPFLARFFFFIIKLLLFVQSLVFFLKLQSLAF